MVEDDLSIFSCIFPRYKSNEPEGKKINKLDKLEEDGLDKQRVKDEYACCYRG